MYSHNVYKCTVNDLNRHIFEHQGMCAIVVFLAPWLAHYHV